ncbi:MAG: lipopolysaccharide biosynthesis protein [Candidatus Omnitrophica bacterium]|nr:lipopolysaccharide biosynthesis protein [Candidatus Omnitrophota bacterium]
MRSKNLDLALETVHGVRWSYLSTVTHIILEIGVAAILARLLEPADFGIIAMSRVILHLGSFFARMGIGRALVQKRELSNEETRAAFTSSLALGLLFFGLAWAIAPSVIYFFKNADVVPVIRIMALSFVLNGLSATAVGLLRRNLKFRSLAIAEIISYTIGYGVIAVFLAYTGFGLWSLVISSLTQSIFLAVSAYLFCRHSLVFVYKWRYHKPLYTFGSRVSLISFLEFIGKRLGTLAIGHFIGAAVLGIYNRAFMLVNIPMENLILSTSRVVWPSFCRIQKETQRLKRGYLSFAMVVVAFLIPACIGISIASRELVLVILGEKWIAAIPILQLLAIAVLLDLLSHLLDVVYEAIAALNIRVFVHIGYIIFLGTLFYLVRGYGVIGFVSALVIGALVRHIAYILIARVKLDINAKDIFTAYMPALVSGLLIGVSLYLVASFLRRAGLHVSLILAAELITGFVLLIVMLFSRFQRETREEILKILIKLRTLAEEKTFTAKLFDWLEKALTTK